MSVPLVYPVLLYLLARVLFAASGRAGRAGALVPHAPLTLLVVGLVFLTAFRIGAERGGLERDRRGLRRGDRRRPDRGRRTSSTATASPTDVERGDTYGPVNYLLYVPFEQALPWSGRWDDLPAAHGAAISFDLLAIGGLLLLGRRLRPGREGSAAGRGARLRVGGLPVHAFVLESNSNDTLVALGCVAALLAASLAREYASRRSPTGVALGARAAAKFVTAGARPAVRAPRRRSSVRHPLLLVLGAHGGAVHPGRRRARAVRPHGRLPGEPPVAVQHLGPGRLARLAPERREGGGRRAGAAGGIRARARPTCARSAALGAGDPDRGPARP